MQGGMKEGVRVAECERHQGLPGFQSVQAGQIRIRAFDLEEVSPKVSNPKARLSLQVSC